MIGIKKAIAAVALTAGTTLGGAVLTDAPPVAAHGDACTAVPDSGWGFNFHNSCHTHDWCYGAKPYGRSEWGRYRCDLDFLYNMRAQCRAQYAWYNPTRAYCYGVAETYYNGVRVGGWYAFWYG